MALSSAINIAASGLSASARLAQITSNNLSNAQTDGYGRRELTLQSGQLGGVRVGGVVRITDSGLISDRRLADADVGRQQSGAAALSQLEQAFGPVGDPSGVAGRLAAFEQALISAGSEPSSDVRLRGVLYRAEDIVKAIRQDADAMKAQRENADRAIARDVDLLNRSLQQVADLNADISRMRNSGQDPSPLLDQRQVIIDRIAKVTPIRQVDRGSDQVAIYTLGGATLIDGSPSVFAFNTTATIMPAMTYAGGVLSGVEMNGMPLDVNDGFGRLRGGSLEASFELRDSTIPALQAQLDNLSADIVARFQDPAIDPSLMPGDPGLFTDGGAPLDPLDITGLSFRLEVNAAVDPERGGAVAQFRDGLNAVVAGPVGDPTQLDRWLGAMRGTSTLPSGGAARTLPGHAADMIADVGSRRLYAEENLGFDMARQTALKTAELAKGVDSDLELQNLLRIEQAYAANARVLQTIDTMMQRLMEI